MIYNACIQSSIKDERKKHMNTIPRFSFQYRGKPFDLADAKVSVTEYGRLYELPDGLRIELHVHEYPEYHAVSWMLWLENRGEYDSGLISDLLDCDATWCFAEVPGQTPPLTLYDTDGCAGYEAYLRSDSISEECKVHGTKMSLNTSEILSERRYAS